MVAKRQLSLSQDSNWLSTNQARDAISKRNSHSQGLQSLTRGVSPPPALKKHKRNTIKGATAAGSSRIGQCLKFPRIKSAAAAIEAGEDTTQDPVTFYSAHILSAIRSPDPSLPYISYADWISLYTNNANTNTGCHFVIHQHDHPVSGTHYDLRLQCNPTSSISFAIMYGLPGDANSLRLNRNAIETRVHCLWNHLIETASYSTGSMLIWDTGVYEVLPYVVSKDEGAKTASTDEDDSGVERVQEQNHKNMTEQEKLDQGFRKRKIKLRLHGVRLPRGYTLSLRLTKENDRTEQPQKPSRQKRRKESGITTQRLSDSESEKESSSSVRRPTTKSLSSLSRFASPPLSPQKTAAATDTVGMEDVALAASEDEDEWIRSNNAYTGATNDIGSIHQRRWYLSIDRVASGFLKQTTKSVSGFTETKWIRRSEESLLASGVIGQATGFDRFIVGGRETERSVVTNRLATQILADEGIEKYVPRGLWRAVTE